MLAQGSQIGGMELVTKGEDLPGDSGLLERLDMSRKWAGCVCLVYETTERRVRLEGPDRKSRGDVYVTSLLP